MSVVVAGWIVCFGKQAGGWLEEAALLLPEFTLVTRVYSGLFRV